MPRTRGPYPPEFRRQVVELVWAGPTPEELGREFEASAQAIRNWVRQAELDEGIRSDGLWYNPHRRHSALAYHSPVSYERRHNPAALGENARPSTEPGQVQTCRRRSRRGTPCRPSRARCWPTSPFQRVEKP